jgi:hypothetical protein
MHEELNCVFAELEGDGVVRGGGGEIIRARSIAEFLRFARLTGS